MAARRLIILILGIFASILLICSMAGLQSFIVTTEVMAPQYRPGDLVIANLRATSAAPRDVVVYETDGKYELGRVLEDGRIDTGAGEVELNEKDFIGTALFKLPWIGNVVSVFLSNQHLMWILIGGIVVYAIFPRKLLARLRKPTHNPTETEQSKGVTAV